MNAPGSSQDPAMQPQRFPAIDPGHMTARQREVADKIAGGPRGGVKGPFLALLHHPELADRLQQVGEHLRFGTGMPQEVVELVILVTARHWDCQYEWYAHNRLARANTRLDPAVIEAVARDEAPAGMPAELQDAYDFCIEVHRHGQPGDRAYAAVEARFGKQGVLDLLATCGYYSLLAMVLNTARIPLPEGEPPPLGPKPSSGAIPRPAPAGPPR
ncbi:MAG TPA: carboxymuconolactone decarboxylase family protein [Bordetella sp.]